MDLKNGKLLSIRPTFGQQLFALIKRNILIKKRSRGRTIMETFFPIYMILIIILLKSTMKPNVMSPIVEAEGNGTNWFITGRRLTFPSFSNTQWFIVSKSNSSEIENSIVDVLKEMDYPQWIIETISFNNTLKSDNEMENYYKLNSKNVTLALQFDINNSSNISYAIRMPFASVPNDQNTEGSIGDCRDDPFSNSCNEMKYYRSGFTFVQSVVDSALIKLLMPKTGRTLTPKANLLVFPKPEYISDNKLWLSFVPTYLAWSFMPLVSILTVMFVMEKERKIKEGMLMMGLRVSAYWLSWILTQAIIIFILSLVVTAIIYFAQIIDSINPVIIFLLLFLFGLSMIGVSAFISPFFKKEKVAGSFASFVTLIASLLHLLVVFLDISPVLYYLLAFLSPVAFTLGVNSITRRTVEMNSYVGFDNLFEDPNFSVGAALLMLLLDCIVYGFLALYLDQVIPGEYGPKRSIFFCLNKSFWLSSKITRTHYSSNGDTIDDDNSDVEEVSDEFKGKRVINIKNITKKFGSGKKQTIAVNNLSMSVYESQITGILGHNGAGKSTLINILVGTIAPTSGTAFIYGYDVSDPTDMNDLRSMFGVCLQQDILFDDLNAEEHLRFFGSMKGITNKCLDIEVNKLLYEVQLFADRSTPSKNLSGGQKRKLCVAIALIGNPKIILLDEPTSGVDAYSRRQLWALLQSYKKDRVILLTTHFMDEADVLSDRKAIISKGRLRCIGSSLFLKNRFGIGYHLTVDIKDGTNIDIVSQLVESKIQNAKIDRFTNSEVFYILPRTQTQLFPELFKALEDGISDKDCGIKSYGISMTTLEEVFLKIGEEVEAEDNRMQYSTCDSDSNKIDSLMANDVNCEPDFIKSFKSFLYIRVLIFIRNPMHILPVIVLPIIMIGVSYGLMKTSQQNNPKPTPLLLKRSIYDKNAVLMYKNSINDGTDQINNFISILVNQLAVNVSEINEFTFKSLNESFMAINISSFNNENNKIEWDYLFNNTLYHSLPILQNLLTNVYYCFLNNINKTSTVISDGIFNTYNYPFPQTDEESNLYSFDAKVYTYVVLMAIMLGSIPPSIAVEVVEDREAKIKDLLRVCGLTFKAYWFTTLVCHLIMFSISSLLILIAIIFVLKLEFLQYLEAVVCVVILFILFMPSSLLTCYVLSHIFNKRDTARSILPLLCYLPGMIMIIFVSILSSFNPETGTILHQIFCFIYPFYVPQGALFWIATTSNMKKLYETAQNQSQHISYFDWDKNITVCFIALIFHLLLFTLLLPIVDILKSGGNVFDALGFRNSRINDSDVEPSALEDDDVKRERLNVQQFLTDGYRHKTPIVLLNNLRKVYSKSSIFETCKKGVNSSKVAINDLNLIVESGHILGLLGPNGAGKTTAIKIMTCDERQTNGMVMIAGEEVKSSISAVFQLIGYCPQHDALWKEITLREHLHLYASIRGIPANQIESVCSKYIEALKISEHSDKKTENLSGGTKRKLCYLISLLGRPKLVLLDEPSTGMDPQAKRFLWKTISSVFQRDSDKSAVLTTHSMEEADALCTRIAIMTTGVMRCIGSVQHLKNKYGAGYVLEIKWDQKYQSINSEKVKHFVSSIFTESVVKEEYDNRLILDIPQHSVQSLSLSHIFSSLENSRKTMIGIEEYSFSQKTIEQVFISFAKEQEESI